MGKISDERREVAERLRGMDAQDYDNEVCVDQNPSGGGAFEPLGLTAGDLADLIDPTCRDMGGSVPGVSAFECSRCGALLNVGDGGGLRVAWHYYDDTPNVSISYCPYRGARIIR